MSSLHRLIAIVVIWLVIAFLGAIMQGLALTLPPMLVGSLYAVMLLAAGGATWAIARAPAAP
jgi:hypothetical protein